MQTDSQDFTRSKLFRGTLAAVAAGVVALLIFQAGMSFGYRKAAFEYRFGDNYYRAFGEHGPRPFGVPMHDEFMGAHGAAGKIVSINLPTIVVSDRGVEKMITVATDTPVRYLGTTISAADLKVDDFVVVLGSPDTNADINAKLIRVVPPPPDQATSTNSSL